MGKEYKPTCPNLHAKIYALKRILREYGITSIQTEDETIISLAYSYNKEKSSALKPNNLR